MNYKLPILLFSLFFIRYSGFAQSTEDAEFQYSHLDKDSFDLSRISELLLKNKVCFLGERHEEKFNEVIHFKVFKQLHDHYGYNTYVTEFSAGTDRLFQKFLNTGSDLVLDSIIRHFSNQENYKNLFRNIYKLHQQDSTVKIIGIDFEVSLSFGLQELYYLLKLHGCETATSKMLGTYTDYQLIKRSKVDKMAELAQKDLMANKSYYARKMPPADLSRYTMILQQLRACLKYPSWSYDDLTAREEIVTANFMKNYNATEKRKYYIAFGSMHTCLTPNTDWLHFKNWTSIASRLIKKNVPVTAGFIYCINLKDKYLEDYQNERHIKNAETRKRIVEKTQSLSLLKMPETEARIHFLIINNLMSDDKKRWEEIR